ncbi:Mono- and diacylglycerol lipase [Hondaea fermentalgiana]|uniref:Mono-and diacylglycerol lipase n=1 Tax=Hondaea fermentalgiana TaxID=2315210 RepID=A0A2R5G4V6_9STRA|nr:Mono- and diacylglycerol lipase [Hondaea fermentalgiana]|eukprot:GBG26062.1 Mono- and diacylglycerol lipase [Hondaea fermentalgiana]
MQVSTQNPAFAGDVTQHVEIEEPKSGRSWKQLALKSFVALGVVGVAAGVGFVAGQASSSSTSTSENTDTVAETAVAQAQVTLRSAFKNETNIAFTQNLTISQINELIDAYEESDDWDDQFMTSDIMSALKTLRDDEQGEVRSLRASSKEENFNRYRQLALTSTQQTIGATAWAVVEEAETLGYSGGVSYENDAVLVLRKSDTAFGTSGSTSGYACWVTAQATGDIADWLDNLDVGDEDIKSIATYSIRDESCGCAKYTWWWCSTYKTCTTYKSYSNGYDGFVKPHNNMRLSIWSQISSTCSSNDRLILNGYSRGGGVMNAFAYAVYKDGLWETSRMVLVTFGSPRVLSDDLSDEIHGQFTQMRFVHDDDIVPSVPYGWMGYKHFGTNKNSNGDEGRDKPGFSTSISDHTSYDDWF